MAERKRGTNSRENQLKRGSSQLTCDRQAEGTGKERTNRPPEVPYDTRICIENLVDTDSDESDIDELREEREVRGNSVEIGPAELVQRKRWNAQTKPSAATWARKAFKSEMCVASCSCLNTTFK